MEATEATATEATAMEAAAMEATAMEAVAMEAVATEEAVAMEAVMEIDRADIAGPAVRSAPRPAAALIGGAASRGAGQQRER